jgi:hypothetical protein
MRTKNTNKSQKCKVVIIIERGLKRAMLQQSIGCKARPEQGSYSDFGRTAIINELIKRGVNVNALISNG